MALGSVEYIIIEFPVSHVQAEIVPELAKLIESGTVRIFDLVFVLKDADGKIHDVRVRATFQELAPFASSGRRGRWLHQFGRRRLCRRRDSTPGSSAVLIVWEDTWANGLYEAVRRVAGR